MDNESQILMLEMQVDELLAKLSEEEIAHKKASSRATATERQNKALRKKTEFAESELAILEQCWNCPDLGNREICMKCSNNAVFEESGGKLQWRGYPKTKGREN